MQVLVWPSAIVGFMVDHHVRECVRLFDDGTGSQVIQPSLITHGGGRGGRHHSEVRNAFAGVVVLVLLLAL
jgi:hypothetical protein